MSLTAPALRRRGRKNRARRARDIYEGLPSNGHSCEVVQDRPVVFVQRCIYKMMLRHNHNDTAWHFAARPTLPPPPPESGQIVLEMEMAPGKPVGFRRTVFLKHRLSERDIGRSRKRKLPVDRSGRTAESGNHVT